MFAQLITGHLSTLWSLLWGGNVWAQMMGEIRLISWGMTEVEARAAKPPIRSRRLVAQHMLRLSRYPASIYPPQDVKTFGKGHTLSNHLQKMKVSQEVNDEQFRIGVACLLSTTPECQAITYDLNW